MKIDTKFNIGNGVYVIHKLPILSEKCPQCKGNASIDTPQGKFVCEKCNGSGKIPSKGKYSWELFGRICIEEFLVTGTNITPIVLASNAGVYVPVDDCFKSLKQAKAECKKRNGKGGKK